MGQVSRIKVARLSAEETRHWRKAKTLAAWLIFSLVYLLGALSAALLWVLFSLFL